jgi:hypothetical protein
MRFLAGLNFWCGQIPAEFSVPEMNALRVDGIESNALSPAQHRQADLSGMRIFGRAEEKAE